MTRPKEKQTETVDRQSVETERRQIPYSQFVVRLEDYSFREEEEFSGPAMKSFEEEIIATRGITNELFARDMHDGTFLLLDGHRRFVALGNIIERQVSGFSREMLIPANVVVKDASERELLARAIGINFQRSPIGALGRIKAAVSLTRHGMPKQESARILGIGTSTLDRDLLLGTTEWIMDHIRRHHITPTTASALLDAAKKEKRVEEFRDELEGWVASTKESCARRTGGVRLVTRICSPARTSGPRSTCPATRLTTGSRLCGTSSHSANPSSSSRR